MFPHTEEGFIFQCTRVLTCAGSLVLFLLLFSSFFVRFKQFVLYEKICYSIITVRMSFSKVCLSCIADTQRPKGFGFVEFEDKRDAQDAIYELDGIRFGGRELKVLLSKEGRKAPDDMRRRESRRRSRSYDRDRSRSRSRGRRSYSRSPVRADSRDVSRERGEERGRSPAGRSRSRSPVGGDGRWNPEEEDTGRRYVSPRLNDD